MGRRHSSRDVGVASGDSAPPGSPTWRRFVFPERLGSWSTAVWSMMQPWQRTAMRYVAGSDSPTRWSSGSGRGSARASSPLTPAARGRLLLALAVPHCSRTPPLGSVDRTCGPWRRRWLVHGAYTPLTVGLSRPLGSELTGLAVLGVGAGSFAARTRRRLSGCHASSVRCPTESRSSPLPQGKFAVHLADAVQSADHIAARGRCGTTWSGAPSWQLTETHSACCPACRGRSR